MSAYRTASRVELDNSRDLWPLRNAYEKRWRNGCDMLSILCAGLIPSTLGVIGWLILSAVPVIVSSYFVLRGLWERRAPLPPDVIARGVAAGLHRKRSERRHDFVDRLILVELRVRESFEQAYQSLPRRCYRHGEW
jgi:hypothetical protein